MKTHIPEISKPEHEILRVLWQENELSVRETHELLQPETRWAYTTTKTVMDRMVNKGLLHRTRSHGVYIYSALVSRPAGLARLVNYFARRVLQTDYHAVVNMFAGNKTLSSSEIEELEKLLSELEQQQKDL